ncbi:lysine histidine transporter 1-like [Lycium barbarum]|uniref:lysine histidine transporter 1-like n=1 Tax=Lycium barbarum TaxID=112863 RepID=UPI00293F75A5|nr:lysine histidine transporter 1-like [Lycium barbarum]
MADERSEEQKRIDEWLPVTSSRNAKWWYSTFHNVTAMVGAGVLSLPYAMAELGWGPGVTVLVISWVITLYTLWQMVEMHEMVPGKRFDRYHELGQYAFGEKLGLWIVVPQQLIVEVGVDIVYMVTGGKSLMKVHDLLCKNDCTTMKLKHFIMIFASVHFLLVHLPNLNSISGVSLAAAVMSLSYSTIAWAAATKKGVQSDVDYSLSEKTNLGAVFNFFSALGDVAFAYAGHNVVLEIQATIPSTPEKPSKGPMWRGVVAYIIVAVCYFPVALIGYWVFGNSVQDNILISLNKPTWLIVMANLFVVVHVIGSYQVFAMPVFDMVETMLVKKLRFRPTWYLRFITRNIYVALTMFIGMAVPFFGGLLGFFGGFAFAPTTYFLPCIMWLAIFKPKRFSLSWIINWICIILGVLLMILAPIGAMRSIILQSKGFKFFA